MHSYTLKFRKSAPAPLRSTLQTRASSRSKSSKTRRKQDRRLYCTKEGSAHEDLGIMAAVHELVTALPALRQEVGLLLRGLAEVGAEGGLLELQEATQGLLEAGEAALAQVWSDTVVQGEGERFGPEATTEDIVRGGQAQAEEYRSVLVLH